MSGPASPEMVVGGGLTVTLPPSLVRKIPSSSGTLPVTSTEPDANAPSATASEPLTPLTEDACGSSTCQSPHQMSWPVTTRHAPLGAWAA